jgi:hypothetical protein
MKFELVLAHNPGADQLSLFSIFGFIFAVFVLLQIYLFPSVIALLRNCDKTVNIALINLIFGWTVIGWFIAFFWAMNGKRSSSTPPDN